jgi:hypothetical protein
MLVNQIAGNLRRLSSKVLSLFSGTPHQRRCLSGRNDLDRQKIILVSQTVPATLRNLSGIERRHVLRIYEFLVISQIDISKWGVVLSLARKSVAIEVHNYEHSLMDTVEPLLS